MKKAKYIKHGNMPPRLPVLTAVVLWLLLDRLGAPGWVYGVGFTVLAVFAIFAVARICTQEEVDVLGPRQ